MSQEGNVDFCPVSRETWEERAKAKVETVEDRMCTIACLITRAGSGRDVWRNLGSKKVSHYRARIK